MYKFFGLVLLSALAAVGAKKISINGPLDQVIDWLNNQQRQHGVTSVPLVEIPLDSKVKYSGAQLLGVDSLRRTSDCWQEVKDNEIVFDINYGFGLAAIVLPHLEIDGTNMSAYATVRDNSVHLSYTATIVKEQCHVKLNELKVEKLGNVEFGASRPEYDGSNLDGFFKLVVTPTLNGIVDSNFAKIEASLQALCKVKDFQNVGLVHELVMSHL
ncbi:uncharacterized protein [Halyomorpha halys]|uniref:uncharacterized protein n=1 Tax=Halyomorpha halys TaxID=286706 RepID=UPI0006D4EFA9|nr:uncharacterized protein LOC106689977 [Halyomorpha halys]